MVLSSINDAHSLIAQLGQFSPPISEILMYLCKEIQACNVESQRQSEAVKAMVLGQVAELEKQFEDENNRLKEVIRRENEERQRELLDLAMLVKKENTDRKKESEDIRTILDAENDKRIKEAAALKDKLEKEKRELQAYLEQDAKEMKAKMDAENRALQEKLDQEASALKQKLAEENETRSKESKALQDKLEKQKDALAEQMMSGSKSLEERMAKDEEARRKEAEDLKEKMEAEKKQQGNSITQMFDRLKSENEVRRSEVHGLKDILVRENENRARETEELRIAMELANQTLGETLERTNEDLLNKITAVEEDFVEEVKKARKELNQKIESEGADIKRKVEFETNEIRDKIQMDKKMMAAKMEEEGDEKRKELNLMRSHLQKEREEMRSQAENDTKMLLAQIDKSFNEVMAGLKKERVDRERDANVIKERIDNEKKEIQLSVDKDRDNMVKKLAEEHDMRRLEQMEMQHRLDNNEKSGKADIKELYSKMKREQDAREVEIDDIRNMVQTSKGALEERIIKEKQSLRETLELETTDLNKRLDKLNLDRMNDASDIQGKLSMFGKSAQRHLDALKTFVIKESQNLFDLTTKPFSVVFNAYRDESYTDGGEDYITFTGCTVNIGKSMNTKSGEFVAPEPGLYMFLVTCCTFDMKKCLLSIRKNGKDVTSLFDQDGDMNRGKTMLGQNILLELLEGDKIQLYAYTSTGITDHKNSHYTQFIGLLLRPSIEMLHAAMRRLANPELDDEVSVADDLSARNPRGLNGAPSSMDGRTRRSVSRLISPPPPSSSGGGGAPGSATLGEGQDPAVPKVSRRGPSSERLMSPQPLMSVDTSGRGPMSPPLLSPLGNGGAAMMMMSPSATVPDMVILEEDEHLAEVAGTNVSNGHHQNQDPPEKRTSSGQSYLALTKLGMGKKGTSFQPESNGPPPQEPPAESKVPAQTADSAAMSNGKKSASKDGKMSLALSLSNPAKKGKSMAEMASSTFKGFAKM